MIHSSVKTILASALLMAVSVFALATTQDEVDEANRQKQVDEARKSSAEARRATAEAEAAEAKAKLGTLDTSKLTKPSGEAKSLNVEGSLLAYSALDRIAEAIAKRVQPIIGTEPVVIYSEKELNALIQSRAFLNNLKILDKEMQRFVVPSLAADNEDCREPKEGGAGLGVLGSIDVALQVLSLFKVDKKMEGADVTVDSFALASAVLAKLKDKGVSKAVYPGMYLAGAFVDPAQDVFSKSEIVRLIDGLADNQIKIDSKLADIARRREAIKVRAEDKKKKLPSACKSAFAEAQIVYDNLEVRGKAVKLRADKYMAAATTVDEKTGTSLLQLLAQSEHMSKSLPGAYVLQLRPIAAGGTTLTKTSLFSTNFRFSGGAIVAYMLVRGTDGILAASGTVAEYGGYVEPKDLSSYVQSVQPVK